MDDGIAVIDAESVLAGEKSGHKSELRLWLRLLSTTTLISAEIRRNLRRSFNITLPQFDLLAQLEREPNGLRLGELSQRMMVTNGNITGLVDKLVEQGFVVREPSPDDRRAMNVRMTKAGASMFGVMAKANEQWMMALFSEVSADVRKALMRELDVVKRSVRRTQASNEARNRLRKAQMHLQLK
jgi:DNA-binding MarR family transcriptional regulator